MRGFWKCEPSEETEGQTDTYLLFLAALATLPSREWGCGGSLSFRRLSLRKTHQHKFIFGFGEGL